MQGSPLTLLEREYVEFRLRCHVSLRQIALGLHRNHGVVSREIRRNKERNGSYSALRAQKKADERKRRNRDRRSKLDEDIILKNHVVSELRKGMKPHVIAGRLKHHPPPGMESKHVCHETIFQWIFMGHGKYEDLYKFLTFNQRKRKKQRAGRRGRRLCIPDRISIHARPEHINERKEYGHWETDSMVFSRQKERLSVQYERKAKYVLIHRLSNGTAEETDGAIQDSILSLPQYLWKTLTFDNGKEGVNHGRLRQEYDIQTYFCDPYASYQKGGVEQTNGIIRHFLPRDTNMSKITQQDIYEIQQKINHTPRRSLNYRTPAEVISELCGKEVVQ